MGTKDSPTVHETGHTVRSSGFVVSGSHPFLGASPDGITEQDELVEVKKVQSKIDENLSTTIYDMTVNRNHNITIRYNSSFSVISYILVILLFPMVRKCIVILLYLILLFGKKIFPNLSPSTLITFSLNWYTQELSQG